jgi:hypothetical protein
MSTSIVSSPRLLKIFLAMRSSIIDDTLLNSSVRYTFLSASYFRFRKRMTRVLGSENLFNHLN